MNIRPPLTPNAEIGTSASIDRVTEVDSLAALELIDYEAVRVERAKELGFGASVLDKLRDEKRRELRLEPPRGGDGQGQPLSQTILCRGPIRLRAIAQLQASASHSKNICACPGQMEVSHEAPH